jgi:integrase
MALWKDRKRGTWHYEFQYRGRRYTGSGFKTKAKARAAKEQRRKEILSRKQIPHDTGFRHIASVYLDYCERRFSEKTYHYKALVCRKFLAFHGDVALDTMTPQMIHEYLHHTCPNNSNYNKHRKDLSALFNFARKKLKAINYNPVWDLDKMPVDEPEKLIPSEQEVLRMIAAADPKKERPLILVILHTLARIDEALRLQWKDVNFEKRYVLLKNRKKQDGSWRADRIDMNEDLYQTLRLLWKRRKQSTWLFYNERTQTRYLRRPKLMRSVCKRAGVKCYGFHALRHFVASYLQDIEKVGTKTVSKLLRHSRVSTTERYLHTKRDAERMALEKLEGKFVLGPDSVVLTENHRI